MPKVKYPFIPKSTAYLKPGHFWSIPLDNGRFACGRVIQMQFKENGKQDARGFLAGLLDWSGDEPPRSETIADCKTIAQGTVHVMTIGENGGQVLGFRALEEDGIEPQLFLSQSPGRGCLLQRGYDILREATPAEQAQLPVFSTWGYRSIKIKAEARLGNATE